MAIKRSLLSKYASIRKPSIFSGSNSTLSSVAKKQTAAEDAIIDNQYETGNLSAESYLSKLSERYARSWITPLQAQNLKEKIESVKVDVIDAEYQRAYQAGKITTKDLYNYEKAKLDKMTQPGSQAYIKQQQKVQGLLDKSEREARTDYRRSEMLRISQMPEDSSERMWEKAQLYDQLEQQARLDGDNDQADALTIQKNNYVNAAKRGDINDLITGTKLQVSETYGAGAGVPSAEEGSKLYGELTGGTGFTGAVSPAVKNSLESLDRQKKSIDRLYQNKSDKEALVRTYEQAVNAATGDQKTQLQIALNNLKSDIVGIDNQIANTTQNITDTVYKIQEQTQKAAAAAFNQEVRMNNREFDKAESDIENAFKDGKITKVEYVAKGLQLAADKAMFSEQVSGVYNQFGNDASADSYLEKSDVAMRIHEQLVNVAQNIDDYEPIFIDKDSPMTNLLGQKVGRGDIVLTDVRQLKDNGQWNQNYALENGVYHRVYYPAEFSDESGYLVSGISAKELAMLRDTAFIYKQDDAGKFTQERINFVQFTDENGDPIMKPVSQSSVDKMLKTGTIISDLKKGLIQVPIPKEPGFALKVGAKTQEFLEKNIPGMRKLTEAYDAVKSTEGGSLKKSAAFYESIFSQPAGAISNFVKSSYQKFSDFASQAVSKAQEVFRGMNIFNPPIVKSEGKMTYGGQGTVSGDIGEIIDNISNEFAPGDDQFRKIMHAIALAESNGNPGAVGDGGISIGLYQNNMKNGRGYGHTKEQLLDPEYNTRLAANELVKYYKQGVKKGLSGANLTAYVSKYGQRPAPGNEWSAAKFFGNVVSGVKNILHIDGGETKDYTTEQLPDPRRIRNIELALGLQPGQYRKGLKQDQGAVDRAFRSNDQAMMQLMKEEGFAPSWEINPPSVAPSPTSQPSAQPSSSWSMPKIELPKINIPQVIQKASTAVKSYFTPTSNAGQNFWSTPVAKALGTAQTTIQKVTQPIVQKAQQAVSNVKSWVSNLFKKK